MTDALHQFSFDGTDVRGELAKLDASYQEVVRRHRYPPIVAQALGELMAATALLSANLKFAGRFTLQLRMAGAVRLLQAETNEQGQLRAIARFDEGADQFVIQDGQLVITLEPDQGQRYQGIVALSGGNISAALEEYFTQSEQLPTRFWLRADAEHATGFMLQKVPAPAGTEVDEDAWQRLGMLAATLKDDELLQLAAQDLLHRLFHEEHTRVHNATPLSFHCTCSKTRLANALHQLGRAELESMLKDMGVIELNCDFCQQHYSFNSEDVDALFPERNLQ